MGQPQLLIPFVERFWGPGRLRGALRMGLASGRVRQLGRDPERGHGRSAGVAQESVGGKVSGVEPHAKLTRRLAAPDCTAQRGGSCESHDTRVRQGVVCDCPWAMPSSRSPRARARPRHAGARCPSRPANADVNQGRHPLPPLGPQRTEPLHQARSVPRTRTASLTLAPEPAPTPPP